MSNAATPTAWQMIPQPGHIRDAMRRNGINSDAELARRAGIARQTIVSVLTGQARATDRTVSALCVALNDHPTRLFAWKAN